MIRPLTYRSIYNRDLHEILLAHYNLSNSTYTTAERFIHLTIPIKHASHDSAILRRTVHSGLCLTPSALATLVLYYTLDIFTLKGFCC